MPGHPLSIETGNITVLLAARRSNYARGIFTFHEKTVSNMEPTTHDSNAAEIADFMHRVFPNCNIASQYYPEDRAWKFQLSFTAICESYAINPPQGCCLMKVQQTGREVIFQIVLFVDDFILIHRRTVAN